MTTESFRREIGKKLSALQSDPDEGAHIAFPKEYTSSDRKYIHKIAESFRLHTQSVGVGDDRYIEVWQNPPPGAEPKKGKGDGKGKGFVPDIGISASVQGQLRSAAVAAPVCSGKVLLSNVKCTSRTRVGASAMDQDSGPISEGEVVEAYWPDDDEWVGATIAEVYEDGSYRIVWASDNSESDVPTDYVRRRGAAAAGCIDPSAPAMSLETFEEALATRRALPAYAKLGLKREDLPGFKEATAIIEVIRDHQVVLLSGETGCGKSTQVPQLIIDSCPGARVLVMQPRKIAAVTLAERIAAERCQPIGRDVGYQAPFAGKSPNAPLVFTTLGIFRKRLLADTELQGITHVVFDEVHERDKLADFNMIFVRDLLKRRKDLRLILMSATLQMETFERYFEGAGKIAIPGRVFPVSELYMDEVAATLYKQPIFRQWLGPGILCGGINIPAGAEGDWNEKAWKTVVFQHTKPEDRESLWGLREKGLESQMTAPFSKARLVDGLRKHDVLQQSSLAFDYPIIEALILHIDRMHKAQTQAAQQSGEAVKPPGTILVFLPGWGDIDQMLKRLVQNFDKNRFKVLPLHSQVTPEQQSEIFEPAPPGIRKIVLTTNIAEASITVEGTEFVIDSGRAKEVSYDPYLKVGTLTTSWISQASAKQRAGRAGRTQGGLCFHLFCRERFDKLDEFLPPELLRSPLEDSALSAKLSLLKMGSTEPVSLFLAKAPDPPEKMAIDNSIQLLVELGAFTKDEQLTALGEHLTKSSLPPRLAKTVLWSILLGCLDDALCVIAAAGGFTRDPFRLQGMDREQAQQVKRDLAAPYNSDHSCMLNAVSGFTDADNQQEFCEKWHLAFPAMRQIRDNQNRIFTELNENKTESFANRNRGNFGLLTAVLCAGIFPNIARRRGTSDFLETAGGKVEARPHGNSAYIPENPDEWVFYQELSQMESTYKLKLVSPIEALPMLLLGGEGPLTIDQGGKGDKSKGGKGGGTTVSLLAGWLRFRTDPDTAGQVAKLRLALQSSFQAFCQRPGDIPGQAALALLDQVATLLSAGSDGGAPNGGVKRGADWAAEGQPPRQAPRPSFCGGKGKSKDQGGFNKGKGFKGKGKGGKW
jgi:ATP-dependent RNA helicase DHX36